MSFRFRESSPILMVSNLNQRGITMNADKVYAETIAKDYVPKLYYKTAALKKLDRKTKKRAAVFVCTFGVAMALKNERGASPVELPSRPVCLIYKNF